ncbi:flagellar hook-length control protein FliK (plasmid) [Paracoccus ferrooxidans]|nr:flagellar hook-length control protein FliK [Paracoccus ferrooxidans]
MLISPGDNPAVTILAERPETFDLLRRNIDLLSKELRDAGISGADISFSDGEEGWSSQNNFLAGKSNPLPESAPQPYLETTDSIKTTATFVNTGIDIRI